MPRFPTNPTTPETKPYVRPTSSSPSVSPSKSPKNGKAWTSEEKVKLFEAAVKRGGSSKAFEGAVEGRTAQQCYMTWHNTMEPAIKRWFEADLDDEGLPAQVDQYRLSSRR